MNSHAKKTLALGSKHGLSAVLSRARRRYSLDAEKLANKELLDIDVGDGYVSSFLTAIEGRSSAARDEEILHVSTIISSCVRKIALFEKKAMITGMKMKDIVPPEILQHGTGITFAQGNAIHDYVKNIFRDAYPDKTFGKWGCACKKTVVGPCVYDDALAKGVCSNCGSKADSYIEISLQYNSLPVIGSPDLLLYDKDQDFYYPVEIKSMAKASWQELERALPNHVIQLLFYWDLCKETAHKVTPYGSILYVNKEFVYGGRSPFKEYRQNASASMARLEPYKAKVIQLVEARSNKYVTLPDRICTSHDTSTAKKCPCVVACFNTNE